MKDPTALTSTLSILPEYLKSKESEVINLGNTIFKSDTASIVGIALLKYLILDNLN